MSPMGLESGREFTAWLSVAKCHKLPSSALSRFLAHIEKCTDAWGPHWEGPACMSDEREYPRSRTG